MTDEVLNIYIQTLLTETIEEEKFERYIDMFSKFMGYTNKDYKYNGTYLGQYVAEFQQAYRALKKKNQIYDAVCLKLITLGKSFKMIVDGSYYVYFSSMDHIQREYIYFDKDKILSAKIEICVIDASQEEYTFCKEYEYLDEKLLEEVYKDVRDFRKRIGE